LAAKLFVIGSASQLRMLSVYFHCSHVGCSISNQQGKRRMAKPRTNYDVSPKRFIEVWQAASSAEEAANTLGMPKPIVHARVSTYRKQGINLKKMKRASKKLDVEGLNELITTLARKTDGQA
jgi:hypothetical protein